MSSSDIVNLVGYIDNNCSCL